MKIGVYAGSFDPFHVGHLHIAKEAQKIFDEVWIVRAINVDKTSPTYSLPVVVLSDLGFVVYNHDGLITDLWKLRPKDFMVMIRGLRNGYDMQAEWNYRRTIEDIHPVPFIYIACPANQEHISSSGIKSLMKICKQTAEGYIV